MNEILEKRRCWIPVYGYGTLLLQCGVIAAMKSAMDQKIEKPQWMRIDLFFIVMALAAFVPAVATLPGDTQGAVSK